VTESRDARLAAAKLLDSPWIHCPACGSDTWLYVYFTGVLYRCAECQAEQPAQQESFEWVVPTDVNDLRIRLRRP